MPIRLWAEGYAVAIEEIAAQEAESRLAILWGQQMVDGRFWLELIAILTGPLGLILLIAQRWKTGKSIGARTVQFATVCLLFPVIMVLGLERILDSATIGTMLGGVAGFVLSRVGEYVPTGSKSGDD